MAVYEHIYKPYAGPLTPEWSRFLIIAPVLVSILIGCHPAIGNGDLQATSASSVVPVVRQLLKPA